MVNAPQWRTKANETANGKSINVARVLCAPRNDIMRWMDDVLASGWSFRVSATMGSTRTSATRKKNSPWILIGKPATNGQSTNRQPLVIKYWEIAKRQLTCDGNDGNSSDRPFWGLPITRKWFPFSKCVGWWIEHTHTPPNGRSIDGLANNAKLND